MTDKPVTPSARDVAKHLDRRQMRRKAVLYGALAAAIALAIVYLTCGKGWGLGGTGRGEGSGSSKGLVAAGDAAPRQCELRLAPEGLTLDGKRVTRVQAVDACKPLGRAVVTVTGNTVQAQWDDLKDALETAGVDVAKVDLAHRESK